MTAFGFKSPQADIGCSVGSIWSFYRRGSISKSQRRGLGKRFAAMEARLLECVVVFFFFRF